MSIGLGIRIHSKEYTLMTEMTNRIWTAALDDPHNIIPLNFEKKGAVYTVAVTIVTELSCMHLHLRTGQCSWWTDQ